MALDAKMLRRKLELSEILDGEGEGNGGMGSYLSTQYTHITRAERTDQPKDVTCSVSPLLIKNLVLFSPYFALLLLKNTPHLYF